MLKFFKLWEIFDLSSSFPSALSSNFQEMSCEKSLEDHLQSKIKFRSGLISASFSVDY
jgi:hypothetical protein